MKLIRKCVLVVSLALTAMFHSCNPAIAAEDDAGYTMTLSDGSVSFDMGVCMDLEVMSAVPARYVALVKSGVATKTDGSGMTVEFCWMEQDDKLYLVGPQGPVMGIPLDSPFIKKRTKS